jgi:hypothetical protein
MSAEGKPRIVEAHKIRWAARSIQEKKKANPIAKVKTAKKVSKMETGKSAAAKSTNGTKHYSITQDDCS